MIFEIFGLTAIVPVLSSLLDPNFFENINIIKNFLPNTSNKELVAFGLFFIVFLYFLKSIYLLFLFYKQNKFIYTSTTDLSNRLFKYYVGQNFSFHINKNKAFITKNLQVEIENFRIYLMSLVTFFVESLLAMSILMTLIFIEPQGALIVGLFFSLLGTSYFQFSKRNIKEWGLKREKTDKYLSKNTIETIEGIKIIKLMEIEDFFVQRFFNRNNKKAKILTNYTTVSEASRYFLELIAVIGLILYVLFLIYIGKDSTKILSSLGLFVAATFRLIPSINRILSSIQKIKYFSSTIDVLKKEFDQFDEIDSKNNTILIHEFKNKIEFKNVSFWHEKDSNKIFENLNLEINKGQYIGLVGPSGSGKSTLLNLLVGLIYPKNGSIIVDGKKLDKNCISSWHSMIGYVPQETFIIDDTIENNIALGVETDKIDRQKLKKVIKQAQLSDYLKNLPNGMNTTLGDRGSRLSGGQKQRIGIARALYSSKNIICLDEATSSLDSFTEKEFLKFVNSIRKGKTIISISHKKSTLESCDFVYKISENKISKLSK